MGILKSLIHQYSAMVKKFVISTILWGNIASVHEVPTIKYDYYYTLFHSLQNVQNVH